MTNKYLKPMLDPGSPRVFNCNIMTRRILAKDPAAQTFFRSRQLNDLLLIKDTIPESERNALRPAVGTKLYFPFNEENIYEGGRTVFIHGTGLDKVILSHFGEDSIAVDSLREDLRIMEMLDRLPSLDPFLMKDVFIRQKIAMNPAYFEVSEEAWTQIETFMLQRFEPLVRAAFPDDETTQGTDDKARLLIDKIWEGRDLEALHPLIAAFRLPECEALDIFSSWRGIVYYSYQYQCDQSHMIDLFKWIKETDHPYTGVPANENRELQNNFALIRERLRGEWQQIETIVREYEDSYDKMFRLKTSSTGFLSFLKNSNKTYWTLGNALGKTNHAIYCWDVMTQRFNDRRLPWAQLQETVKMLATILQPDKKTTTNMVWQ